MVAALRKQRFNFIDKSIIKSRPVVDIVLKTFLFGLSSESS